MAGYRAGLTLALPTFDTCNCLENYARNPWSYEAKAAFFRLKARAERELLYDALVHGRTLERARALLSLRTGISDEELSVHMIPDDFGGVSGVPDLSKLSDDEAADLYRDLCRTFGDPVDLSDSTSAQPAPTDISWP